MIPILYSPAVTNLETQGLGALSSAAACTVKRQTFAAGGVYELELQIPQTAGLLPQIAPGAVIKAKPSANEDPQPFRIYAVTRPMRGLVTVYAYHESYRLNLVVVSPFTAASLSEALTAIANNAVGANPFTITADFTDAMGFTITKPTPAREVLRCIMEQYGCEADWDGYTVTLTKSLGRDTGYDIRYGKNLIDLKQEHDISETYTAVYPYWQKDQSYQELVLKVIPSQYESQYPFRRLLVLDCSDAFDAKPTTAQLRAYATSWMTENNIGIPRVSIEVNFVNLADLPEYKDLATGNIDLYDSATVIFEKLGISRTAQVVETQWDVLKDRYIKVTLGDPRPALAKTIADQMDELAVRPTADEVASTIDRATGLMHEGAGGHMVTTRNEGGWANELLFLDTADISTATKILRINNSGIGFANAYAGPYYQAWTLDGHMSLGGVNNAYGHLSILDKDGQTVGEWTKDGIVVYEGVLQFLRDVNDQEKIGLYVSRNVIKIGDFEVNDRWGRQIIESNDERTGMSGASSETGSLYLWAGWISAEDSSDGRDHYRFVVNDTDAYVWPFGINRPIPIGDKLVDLEYRVSQLEMDI